MGERSWRGQWWVSDDPNLVIPGTLHNLGDGSLRLELIGGFDVNVWTSLPGGGGLSTSSAESRDFPLVYGVCDGERFTLFDAIATSTQERVGGISTQELISNRALRGIHLVSRDVPLFTRAVLQLGRLLDWSNRSTFYKQPLTGNPTRERTAGTRPVAPATAIYNDVTVGLHVRSSDFHVIGRLSADERSMVARESAVLELEVAEPVTVTGFDEVCQDIQDLLTLSAYEPCGWLGQWLYVPAAPGSPGKADTEVEVLGRRTYQANVPENEPRQHDFLFTLADLDFPDLMPRWLALKDRARLGFNILLGLRYISRGYVGSRLLGAATAAETIHDGLYPNSTRLPEATFDDLRSRLFEAIAGEPGEVRSFLSDALKNRPTYRTRMSELASIPDSKAVEGLLTDPGGWAKLIKNARNAFAHANERSVQDIDSTSAHWLLEVTYALLCLVAMEKLGLSADVQRRALGNSKINWAAAQFKKFVTE